MLKTVTNFLDSLVVSALGLLAFVWLYLSLGPNGRREFRLFLGDLEAIRVGEYGDAERPPEGYL